MSQSRQLAAIMFTDIVGYTALMSEDEQQAFELLKKNRLIQRPIIEKYHGRWLKEIGDGVLASFNSVSDAVNCAREIQKSCLSEPDLKLRIGIHQGEVVFEDNDVFGDGVNIASRLEPLAPVGGILVSGSVYKNVHNKKDIETIFLGEEQLRGVKEAVKIYQIKIPGGIPGKPEVEVKRKLATGPSAGGRLVSKKLITGMASLLLLLLIGYFLIQNKTGANVDPAEKFIAVLPLDIIGADPEGEYFAAGVREEILNHLSLLEGLNVKSRSVVDRMGEGISTEELVSRLKLTHYLEGSAQKVGSRIRITVQLIDANTNDHVWAESYERNYDNLLDTQTEIARKVAEELNVSISPEIAKVIDKIPTDTPMAWDDYLKAQYYFRKYYTQREPENLKKTVMFLKSSIQRDPDFALGYSSLALAYQQQPADPEVVFDFIDPDSVLILCNRAIALDPGLSAAYIVRADHNAFTLNIARRNEEAAEIDYNKALNLSPNDPYVQWRLGVFYGGFEGIMNRELNSGLKHLFTAIDYQPEPWLLANILAEIGWIYLEVADYAKAEQYMDKALSYDPENIYLMGYKSQLFKVTKKYDKLYDLSQKVMEISPLNHGLWDLGQYYLLVKDYPRSVDYFNQYFSTATATATLGVMFNKHMYGYALLKTGNREKAEDQFQQVLKLIHDQGHPTPSYEFAKIYAAQGMKDSAYYHLEKAVNGPIRWGMSDFMETDPLFENIKDEPEFQRLVAIAREKVREKREEVRKLEASGEIPASIDELELY